MLRECLGGVTVSLRADSFPRYSGRLFSPGLSVTVRCRCAVE